MKYGVFSSTVLQSYIRIYSYICISLSSGPPTQNDRVEALKKGPPRISSSQTAAWCGIFISSTGSECSKCCAVPMRFSLEPLSPKSSECFPMNMKEPYVSHFKGKADKAPTSHAFIRLTSESEKCPWISAHCSPSEIYLITMCHSELSSVHRTLCLSTVHR